MEVLKVKQEQVGEINAELLEALKELKKRSALDAEKYAPQGNEPIWAFIADASDAISKAGGKS